MQQTATRLRCDPTDYAKRQQERKERAKQLREQRQHGICSEQHTFSPKVNQRPRNRSSPPGSREEFDCGKPDTMALPNHGNSNNYQGVLDGSCDGNDALENLSRKFPKRVPQQEMASLHLRPPEPEHDTLFQEVKRATGREIDDLPIKKPSASLRIEKHIGPCLRNSSCGCPKCGGDGSSISYMSSANIKAPLLRQRELITGSSAYLQKDSSVMATQYEMGNSLALLKSRMSRRKARSAPTNKASLFVEKNIPSAVVHSARLPSMSSDAPSPPSRQKIASRRAPAQTAVDKLVVVEDHQVRSPTISGFNVPEELDEYADGTEQMEQCSNCNRKFIPASYQKHRKICEKVFSGQRKVFNMTAKRLEGTEAEKLLREAKTNTKSSGARKTPSSATDIPIKVKSAADWKQKSDMFRNAMKASRDVSKALKEGKELPPMQPSAPDPSLIQCEYCSRRFNEKAAERHINFCREKSQRDSIKGGAKRVPAGKPGSRGAAVRKR